MKTIDIPVQVPDWTTRVAQDEDGTWFAYSGVIWPLTDCWDTNGHNFMVYRGPRNPNWRETLREVE